MIFCDNMEWVTRLTHSQIHYTANGRSIVESFLTHAALFQSCLFIRSCDLGNSRPTPREQ